VDGIKITSAKSDSEGKGEVDFELAGKNYTLAVDLEINKEEQSDVHITVKSGDDVLYDKSERVTKSDFFGLGKLHDIIAKAISKTNEDKLPKYQKYNDSEEGEFGAGDTVSVMWKGKMVSGEVVKHEAEKVTGEQGEYRHSYFVKLPDVDEPQKFFQDAFIVENLNEAKSDDEITAKFEELAKENDIVLTQGDKNELLAWAQTMGEDLKNDDDFRTLLKEYFPEKEINEDKGSATMVDPAKAQEYLDHEASHLKAVHLKDEVLVRPAAKPEDIDDADWTKISQLGFIFKFDKKTGNVSFNEDQIDEIKDQEIKDKLLDEYNAFIGYAKSEKEAVVTDEGKIDENGNTTIQAKYDVKTSDFGAWDLTKEDDQIQATSHVKSDIEAFMGSNIKVKMVSFDGVTGENADQIATFIVDLEGTPEDLKKETTGNSPLKYEWDDVNEGKDDVSITGEYSISLADLVKKFKVDTAGELITLIKDDQTEFDKFVKKTLLADIGKKIKLDKIKFQEFDSHNIDHGMGYFEVSLTGSKEELEKVAGLDKAVMYSWDDTDESNEDLGLPDINIAIIESLGIKIYEATDWNTYVPEDIDDSAAVLSAMNMTVDKNDSAELKKLVDEFTAQYDSKNEMSLAEVVKKAGMSAATSLLKSLRKFKFDYTDDIWKNMETSVTEAKKKEQKPKTKKEEEDIAKAVQDNKDLKARFNADPKNKVILDQLNSVEKFLGLPLTKLVAENKWSSLKIASECKNGDHIGDIITVDGKYGIVKDRTADGKTTYLNEEDKLVTVDSTSITESTVDENAAKVSVDKRYNNFSDAEILELEDRRFKEMFKKKIFYRGDNVIFKRDGKVYITIGDNSPVASVDLKGALTKAKVA
jgi:hypothetical protein